MLLLQTSSSFQPLAATYSSTDLADCPLFSTGQAVDFNERPNPFFCPRDNTRRSVERNLWRPSMMASCSGSSTSPAGIKRSQSELLDISGEVIKRSKSETIGAFVTSTRSSSYSSNILMNRAYRTSERLRTPASRSTPTHGPEDLSGASDEELMGEFFEKPTASGISTKTRTPFQRMPVRYQESCTVFDGIRCVAYTQTIQLTENEDSKLAEALKRIAALEAENEKLYSTLGRCRVLEEQLMECIKEAEGKKAGGEHTKNDQHPDCQPI
ncbi:unnamed protein product, partial [Mesorhabditis spiculigera]